MATVKITKWFAAVLLTLLMSYLLISHGISKENAEDKSLKNSPAPEEIINPHFTGKDCDVCHEETPKPGQKDLQLKFGGNDIAMCDSCHQTEHAKGDLHPVNITPVPGESFHIPEELPLYQEKITCRTCHFVYYQCKKDPTLQFENVNFLRGAPYDKTLDLCFRCHNIDVYKKSNPHEQVDQDGTILNETCLYCHQSLPDPDTVSDIEGVTFKTETSTFCVACHAEEEFFHPAYANHMVLPSEEIKANIDFSVEIFEVILPLFKKEIFCGTCHNPHDKNIIKRKEADKGSETEHRLRLEGSFDLCIACHKKKEGLFNKELTIEIADDQLDIKLNGEGPPSYHKAFLEKKCRACHTVTRKSPERPIVYKMCFLSECHDASLIKETFKHSEALHGECLLCHNQHGSQYGAHIVNDQQKLCKTCHPLLIGNKEEQKVGDEEDLHDYYTLLFRHLVADREISCSFCHGEDHRDRMEEHGITSCYQCHNYVKNLIRGKKGKPENIHESFLRKKCSSCHNPHSSPYQHLLKEEPASYK